MTAWILLSTKWKLEDVQAGLNVIISVLCVVLIFTSSRYFWQRTVAKILKGHDVSVPALLTFTTPGEIIDVFTMFKAVLFQSKYVVFSIQGTIVIFSSLSAMFAGPITRYSTRNSETTELQSVQGRLATRSLSCDVNDIVRWQEVYQSLESADFPLDRLLDFLPGNTTDWVYNAVEWNETYSMACNFTPQTTVQLNATGNYVNDTLLYLYDEIPGLWNILSPGFRQDDILHNMFYDGYRDPANGIWDDVIVWDYVELTPANVSDQDNSTTQWQTLAFTVVATYMKGAPEFNLTDVGEGAKDWVFGVGSIPEAYYTKFECEINRNRPSGDGNYYEAYPELTTNCDMAQQFDQYFGPAAIQPSGPDAVDPKLISIPSGEQMLRFYQAFMVAKDTFYPNPFSRDVSVRISTVELSVIFVVICSLTIFIVILGLLNCAIFYLKYRRLIDGIPETKIDWMLQAVKEARVSRTPQLYSEKTLLEATFVWHHSRDVDRKGSGSIRVGSHLMMGDSPSNRVDEKRSAVKTSVLTSVVKHGESTSKHEGTSLGG